MRFLLLWALWFAPVQGLAQTNLPLIEDFEETAAEVYSAPMEEVSIAGAPGFTYETADGGRLRTNAGVGFARSGNAALTLDREVPNTPATNFVILTADLSMLSAASDTIVLKFAWQHHREEPSANDRVWVRGSNTAPFVQVFNWSANLGEAGTYQQTELDVSQALQAAGQDFSSTFQVRWGQQDTSPATSPAGDTADGLTIDDVSLRRLEDNDVGIADLVQPAELTCGSTTTQVVVRVDNDGLLPQTNIPIEIQTSPALLSSTDEILPFVVQRGESATVRVATIDTSGFTETTTVTFSVSTALPEDTRAANDAQSFERHFLPTRISVSATPACLGDPSQLSVAPEPLTTFIWTDAPRDGDLLASGPTYSTPPLDVATTVYVTRVFQGFSVGPADTAFGSGSQHPTFSDGLVFNVGRTTVLHRVSVYPGSEGLVVVRILDPDGTEQARATRAVIASDVGRKTEIEINETLAPGTGYRIDAQGSTVTSLFRNENGASYPYASVDQALSITGSIDGLTAPYSFFYNWEISTAACPEPPTEVVITPTPAACVADLAVTQTLPNTAAVGETITATTVVTNNGPDSSLDVTLDDAAPAGLRFRVNSGDCTTAFPCSLGILPPNTSATVLTTYVVDASGSDRSLDLATTVASSALDSNPANNSVTNSIVLSGRMIDLSTTMIASSTEVIQGDPVTYTVIIANAGPANANNVVLDISAPVGLLLNGFTGCEGEATASLCRVGAIDAGATTTIGISAETRSTITGTLNLAVSTRAAEPDIDSADNQAVVTITVSAEPAAPSEGTGCSCMLGASDFPNQSAIASLWLIFSVGLFALRRQRQ